MADNPRVWFITGVSSGFGRAIAEAVLARGETVVGAARRPEKLHDRVSAVAFDVTDTDRCEALLDVLVNNA